METSANVMSQRNRRREREDEYLQNRCNVRRVVNGNTRTDSLRPSGKTMVPAKRARPENGSHELEP